MGRIMAIDYGQKRVGIAVTDPERIIATGLKTIPSSEIFSFLDEYLLNETVDCIVVGEPLQMDNTPSQASRYIEPFVKKLKKNYPTMLLERIDERFTSKIAAQTILAGGIKKKSRQNKSLVDTVSATIILQSFMESNPDFNL